MREGEGVEGEGGTAPRRGGGEARGRGQWNGPTAMPPGMGRLVGCAGTPADEEQTRCGE